MPETIVTEWLTQTDAASALGVSVDTLRAYCDRGRITSYRMLGRKVFRRADVEALRDKRNGATTELSRLADDGCPLVTETATTESLTH